MEKGNEARVQKLYYRIGEVAQLLGVEPSVLRHWETKFPSCRPARSKSGQRVYHLRDVQQLEQIKQLHYREGYTLKGVRGVLRRRGVEPREHDDPVMVDNRRMREALLTVRRELLEALADAR